MKTLCNVVQGMESLISLRIIDCSISEASAGVLFENLRSVSGLREIMLNGTALGSAKTARLCEFLSTGPDLISLSLHRCKLGSNGVKALSAEIGKCGSLKSIVLSCNGIGESAAMELLQEMKVSGRRAIDLRANNLPDMVGFEYNHYFRSHANWFFECDSDNFRSFEPKRKNPYIPDSFFIKEEHPLSEIGGRRAR